MTNFLPVLMLLGFLPPFQSGEEPKSLAPHANEEIFRLVRQLRERTNTYVASSERISSTLPRPPERILPHGGLPSGIADQQALVRRLEMELLDRETDLDAVAFWRDRQQDLLGDSDGAGTDARGYLGIEWSVLRDGWYSRKRERRDLELDSELVAEWSKLRTKIALYPILYNEYLYLFNRMHITSLERLLSYLDSLIHLAHDLYYFQLTSWEDLIEMGRKRRKHQVLLDTYRHYNEAHESLPQWTANG